MPTRRIDRAGSSRRSRPALAGMKWGGMTISASAPGGLGGLAVVHREVGARGAGVDDHRHAAVDGLDDARVTWSRSASLNLKISLPSATPRPCTPARDVELDEAAARLSSSIRPSLVERGDEDGDDAALMVLTRRSIACQSAWNISSTGSCTGEKSGLVSMQRRHHLPPASRRSDRSVRPATGGVSRSW